MHATIGPSILNYAPGAESTRVNTVRVPAAPGTVQRFELLMYSPAAHGTATSSAAQSGSLRHYIEALSSRWDAGQRVLSRMTESGQFTSRDLIQTQMKMINCALDVEVSSKCASMFENGVQTLIQRGS